MTPLRDVFCIKIKLNGCCCVIGPVDTIIVGTIAAATAFLIGIENVAVASRLFYFFFLFILFVLKNRFYDLPEHHLTE